MISSVTELVVFVAVVTVCAYGHGGRHGGGQCIQLASCVAYEQCLNNSVNNNTFTWSTVKQCAKMNATINQTEGASSTGGHHGGGRKHHRGGASAACNLTVCMTAAGFPSSANCTSGAHQHRRQHNAVFVTCASDAKNINKTSSLTAPTIRIAIGGTDRVRMVSAKTEWSNLAVIVTKACKARTNKVHGGIRAKKEECPKSLETWAERVTNRIAGKPTASHEYAHIFVAENVQCRQEVRRARICPSSPHALRPITPNRLLHNHTRPELRIMNRVVIALVMVFVVGNNAQGDEMPASCMAYKQCLANDKIAFSCSGLAQNECSGNMTAITACLNEPATACTTTSSG
ncbi:unnamed protein product [Sphagnum balticum]